MARLGAAALVGGSLLVAVAPAHAADENVLHVGAGSADCADDGPGTADRPFCTIGAAAARVGAGQTVKIAEGEYPERVTIPASGTSEKPISFVGSTSGGRVEMTGPTAGFVIDGQRHIRIENVTVLGAVDVPGFDLTGAAGITLDNVHVARNDPTAPALRFTGVSESSVTRLRVSGARPSTAVVLDAATTGVTIDSASLWSRRHEAAPDGAGIQVEGTGNTIVNSVIDGIGAGIRVGPAATGTVVANNDVRSGTGHGIHNQGASETAIANNLVAYNCGNGIRVDGASVGVSVQNNVVDTNGVSTAIGCATVPAADGQIAVHDAAAGQTVVDYNNTYDINASLRYGWKGGALSLAEFRTASGQAANDRESRATVDTIDSANSAAPGYPATDREGVARVDDFGFANTGAGPVPYADRGPREVVRTVYPHVEARLDLGARSVTLDASVPSGVAGTITSYEFAFGDGTVVTQESAVATHRYASYGTRSVTVRVRNSDGQWSGGKTLTIAVAEPTDSIGLYVPEYGSYVTAFSSAPPPIYPSSPYLSSKGAQFDLVDGGDGRVAIFSRSAGRYVTAYGSGLSPDGVTYDDPLRLYRLVRNSDGSVSLRAEGSGRYVTAGPYLVASATEIGTREKFYRVNVGEAGRSLKAKANDRFVTADSEGTKPLIANRTAVGGWERFDLIDLGNSQVAFLAHADRQYVTAEKAGAEPLISARYGIGGWEKFLMVRHADGTVSFKALANDRYVTAEDGGAKPLIASRASVGSWEKFTLG